MGALAAVPLLAKHEQKSPSAEQPILECCGGEEQGNATHEDLCCSVLDKYVFIGPPRLLLRLILPAKWLDTKFLCRTN